MRNKAHPVGDHLGLSLGHLGFSNLPDMILARHSIFVICNTALEQTSFCAHTFRLCNMVACRMTFNITLRVLGQMMQKRKVSRRALHFWAALTAHREFMRSGSSRAGHARNV